MIIDFLNEAGSANEESLQLVEDVLQFVAKKEDVAELAELSVSFVTNDEIQEINKTYRNKDTVTDVISFAMQEQGEGEVAVIGEQPLLLGDIIISVDRAVEQAADYGHSIERELAFLAAHGLLHILGYDHMTSDEEKVMFAKQEQYLTEFGLPRSLGSSENA
ncbi:rRNA maturation RNase YbeY [Chryseomicrobium sp. FSL W7-1435]|uniref:rRNA maturation RNase YbeY n=1 Tax=Chryseomicrobium sp. FSL W7-1435 TaxID=2921704 RepID=UPI00315A11EA